MDPKALFNTYLDPDAPLVKVMFAGGYDGNSTVDYPMLHIRIPVQLMNSYRNLRGTAASVGDLCADMLPAMAGRRFKGPNEVGSPRSIDPILAELHQGTYAVRQLKGGRRGTILIEAKSRVSMDEVFASDPAYAAMFEPVQDHEHFVRMG